MPGLRLLLRIAPFIVGAVAAGVWLRRRGVGRKALPSGARIPELGPAPAAEGVASVAREGAEDVQRGASGAVKQPAQVHADPAAWPPGARGDSRVRPRADEGSTALPPRAREDPPLGLRAGEDAPALPVSDAKDALNGGRAGSDRRFEAEPIDIVTVVDDLLRAGP